MADYYEQLSACLDPGCTWQQVAFSGGIAQQATVLREQIMKRLQVPWRLASTTEDSLFGMIILGRVIAGFNETVAEAAADARKHMTGNET